MGGLLGLTDKLYWRQPVPGGPWHCFDKVRGRPGEPVRFLSLCHRATIKATGGQAIDRPKVFLRCGMCDGLEATRRGHEESLPERRSKASLERERARAVARGWPGA